MAQVWSWVDCCVEMDSEPRPAAQAQAYVAAIGLAPAVGTLVASLLNRGRPWYWFGATAAVYALWGPARPQLAG